MEWVKRHITAILQSRPRNERNKPVVDFVGDSMISLEQEHEYDWRPTSVDYFPDIDDPRRQSFIRDFSTLNFRCDKDMNFVSGETQRVYRMATGQQHALLLFHLLEIQSTLAAEAQMQVLLPCRQIQGVCS